MENARIAAKLDRIADLIDLEDGSPFRVRSYRRAAQTVREHARRLADLAAAGENLSKLPNIGASIAGKIEELIDTGQCDELERLEREVPPALTEVMDVPRLGPRKAMRLHEALGVASLDDLAAAAEAHEIRDVEGFGEKTEAAILRGIGTVRSGARDRFLLHDAAQQVRLLERHLEHIDALAGWHVAGSYRRRQATVGDLDVLLEARDRDRVVDAVTGWDEVAEVVARGREKVSVALRDGLAVDFRFFEARSFGAALLYFTGSKAHNVALRKRCQAHGWKLSEYGLFKGDRLLAGRDEAAVYHRLGLDWIPPELREDRGEIEAAGDGALPRLIRHDALRGDLHCHTEASDGIASIEAMAERARERGYEYLAITDHSQRVSVANGLDERRLRRHARRIRELDQQFDDLWLLAGVEVDILEDGDLDLTAKCLEGLDWVVASVHYHQDLDEAAMTARLVKAIESGLVHCLGHPLGRLIGRREPISFDTDRVLDACAANDVRLEIDAQPARLDLPDSFCQQAKARGVGFVIDSDAHKPDGLDLIDLGIDVARRGWLEARDVLNTRSRAALARALGR